MSIKLVCFGGKIGWKFKQYFPHIAANAYIKLNFFRRRRKTKEYIRWFLEQDSTPQPQIVEIETINRCNSTCSFCPANRNDDKRPFAQMNDEIFYKIIDDLKNWKYEGMLSLYVNNEPLIDNRMVRFHKYVKEKLPKCKIKFFTNGILLTLDKFLEIIPFVDYMVINNYGENAKMHENIENIYLYVKAHEEEFTDKKITINIRYIKDILTNRAGGAPNKKATNTVIKEPCLFPFTDLTVFANGNVGICCNDATEKSCLGNVQQFSLKEIWENERKDKESYALIRRKIASGRNGYYFCKHCDTLDSGLRVKISKGVLTAGWVKNNSRNNILKM